MSASRVLARITVAPALLVVAWLMVSLPLLLAGLFRPGPAIALFLPAAAIVLWLGLRDRPRGPDEPAPERLGPVPWWVTGSVLAITIAFLVLQIVMCSEQVIVRRDPASYVQFATWLNDHGSLPIPQMRWAFGGGDRALGYASPAFYEQGTSIVPQFMAGLPMILALGGWIGGTYALLAMAPVLGACAVLSFAGLTARMVGPRWAPAGALFLALTLPMLWVSRSTLSELPALVLLLGGLALMYDVRAEAREGLPQSARAKAFLGGMALGLIVLVRIDGLRDVLPVVVIAGLLVARRRMTGTPLAMGLAFGVGAGLIEGFVLSRPYLKYLHASFDPLLAMTVLLVAATAALVGALRWKVTGPRLRRIGAWVSNGRLPGLAAVLTVLVMIGFAVRPYFQTVRRVPDNPDDQLNAQFIESIQRIEHLTVDGTRQYSELSLYWVIWYIGVPALLLATFGAALLVRRLLRRQSPEWLLPYAVFAFTTVAVLWRPGITPDHPWATRRLIGVVIPGLLLFAVWALAWVFRRMRRLGYGKRVTGAAAVLGVAVLVVPIAVASAGFMVSKSDQGEVAAVRSMCDRLGPGRSIVIVDRPTADRFLQVVRSMCGLPAARTVETAKPQDVQRVIGKIYAAGRRPVILGAEPQQVSPYGPPAQVIALRTRQDPRTLLKAPSGTWTFNLNVWMSEPAHP
ncbi:hypothetical protein J4573_15255 [Actinomadura barringtoniae]|uniref:Glycosyltransferase RgtA/B/C/D-like domain-containing protein n=1 Tax=Actinomadura barringtoniae TaxID=1427535 RepID=A0A939PE60_9ACTN|nr:hypothetical protein [Actinomadura barringtoniae]MBO2448458.1 hypothetical protein [Actinomadura barringtoniae]